jgi:hypothetical protein
MITLSDALVAVEYNMRIVEKVAQVKQVSSDEAARLQQIAHSCSTIAATIASNEGSIQKFERAEADDRIFNADIIKLSTATDLTGPSAQGEPPRLVQGFEHAETNDKRPLLTRGESSRLVSGFEHAETEDNKIHAHGIKMPKLKKIQPTNDEETDKKKLAFGKQTAPLAVRQNHNHRGSISDHLHHLSEQFHHLPDHFPGWHSHKVKPEQLSDEEFKASCQAFKAFSDNAEGTIAPEELFSVMSCLGIVPTGNELHTLLQKFDGRGHAFGFDEFIDMIVDAKVRETRSLTKSLTFKRSSFRHGDTGDPLKGVTPGAPLLERLSSATELVQKAHSFNCQRAVLGNSKVHSRPEEIDNFDILFSPSSKFDHRASRLCIIFLQFIFHPEDPSSSAWELFINVLLCVTLLTMPLSMAFFQFSSKAWYVLAV